MAAWSCILPMELRWYLDCFMGPVSRGNNDVRCLEHLVLVDTCVCALYIPIIVIVTYNYDEYHEWCATLSHVEFWFTVLRILWFQGTGALFCVGLPSSLGSSVLLEGTMSVLVEQSSRTHMEPGCGNNSRQTLTHCPLLQPKIYRRKNYKRVSHIKNSNKSKISTPCFVDKHRTRFFFILILQW